MKAFWWFRPNQIAGMARPGFNSCQWFDLPFDEAMLMGWLGQYSVGAQPLSELESHLNHYLPKTRRFYGLSEDDIQKVLRDYRDPAALGRILERLTARSKLFRRAEVVDDHVHVEICRDQLGAEAAFLKSKGIGRIVTLTESPHLAGLLDDEFELHHIGIQDLGAPTIEQAQILAEILARVEADGERLAVHCLAGIGRTSTMLIAAEILRGKKLNELLSVVQKNNPHYVFVGSQGEFLKSLAGD